MSNKELLKDLLKKLLNEKLLYLEEKGKEDISSLSYTKTEFDSLGKKIEALVKLREEKIKKDKIEEEKREKEKTEKVQRKNIQPQTSRKSIGIKISPSKSNFHRKEPKQNLNTTSDFGRKTLTNTKSLGNIFGGRKSLGPNTERMSTRPSIGRDKSGGRKSIGNNLFNNNKNESIGRKSIQPLLKSSNTTTNLFGKKNTNVNKGKGNIKKNNISINNNNNVNNCSNKKICFNDLIEKDIVNNNIIPYLNDNDKLVFYSINKKLYLKTLIEVLNNIQNSYKKIFGLLIGQTYESKLNLLEMKYKPEELNAEIPAFTLGRGTIKALELLDQESYLKLFQKPPEQNKLQEILIVYKIFCQLLKKEDLVKIKDEREFWEKFSKYVMDNKTETLSKFFIDSTQKFYIDNNNLNKVRKLAINQLDKINPSYYGKICGTTGLVVFLIKEMLIYVGIIEDKKTSPAKIKENILYQKNIIDKLNEYYEIVKKIEEEQK
jgi:hypothetical protein